MKKNNKIMHYKKYVLGKKMVYSSKDTLTKKVF